METQDRVTAALDAAPASAAELGRTLGLSQPTVSRALRRAEAVGAVFRIGRGRSVRYARTRAVADAGHRWPLYRIGADGGIESLGEVRTLAPRHVLLDGPLALAGVTDHLPYLLEDLRPAGFLGRAIPRAHPTLRVPSRTADWTDDHVLLYLVRHGTDLLGDLVVGADALEAMLAARAAPLSVDPAKRTSAYPKLAEQALAGATAGASAHGEQPKFTTRLEGTRPKAVLVKFSPPLETATGGRWADLLVAEHLAHTHLREAGIAAPGSEIVVAGGRTFLEVERFDRIGAHGRRGIVSLLAVDTWRYGELDRWSRSALRLAEERRLPMADVETIRLVEAFAMLIANDDRHFGNLSLYDDYTGRWRLAPIYDMLPMALAPASEGAVPALPPPLPGPSAETFGVWRAAGRLAHGYWSRLEADARLSPAFRDIVRGVLDQGALPVS
jgi:DNA-binding transcriptional ArsR family regulator